MPLVPPRAFVLAPWCLAVALAVAGCQSPRVARAPAQPQPAPPLVVAPEESAAPEATNVPLDVAAAAALAGKIPVALLLPLSGPNATLGRAMLEAAQLAVFDVGDDRFVLLPQDTASSANGAAGAASNALARGARLVLGPLLATEVEAVAPVARSAGVPIVAFSTATQLAGNGVFLMSFPPRQEVARVAAAARQRGIQRFAALAPQTPYGQITVEELQAAAAAGGASVTRVEFYDPAAADISPVVRRLAQYDQRRAALTRQRQQLEAAGDEASRQALRRLAGRDTAGDPDFEALLLPEGGGKLRQVAALLPFYDIETDKVRLLGTGLWDEPGLGSEPALVGGWFAAPPPESRADFDRKFQEVYKRRPPRLASLAYDATALAAILARADGGPRFTVEALADPDGFAGVDGIFRFLPDGTIQRGLAVLEVRRDGSAVVVPAPETFEDLTF